MHFQGQRVIITGASAGIGAELARQLSSRGARVALASRRKEHLEQVAAGCRELGGTPLVVPTDITDAAQCSALVDEVVAAWGGLDMLINNAGRSMHALFQDISDLDIFQRLMRVNYFGAVYCTHAALPHLLAAQGRIVAVSSLAGKAGIPTRTGYSAGKHALHGFLDALRTELHGTGVSVTIVCPSYVASGTRRYTVGAAREDSDAARKARAGAMSVQRCAGIILRAAARRRREVVMTLPGKLGRFVRPFFPGLIDRIARRKVGLGP